MQSRRCRWNCAPVLSFLALAICHCPTHCASADESCEQCCEPGLFEGLLLKTWRDWRADEWRLVWRGDRPRPKTIFAWPDQERVMLDGSERGPLESDRPDFTQSTETVGLRRAQVELGYSYIRDDAQFLDRTTHSYPETLLRVGMLAEWFELRVGWNYGVNLNQGNAVSTVFSGGQDMYVGAKVALVEQNGLLPRMTLMPQLSLPTGDRDFTGGKIQPGLDWLYAWDLTERLVLCGSTQVNESRDLPTNYYAQFAQSFVFEYATTDKLTNFAEWFCFMPAGAEVALPQQYFDCGGTYHIHDNFQLDIRIGWGLNDAADDYFTGAGAELRF
jgi:hypothetical protein